MRFISTRTVVGSVILGLFLVADVAAQTMEKVGYFPDSIAEKGDQNFVIRLNGGSSWVLASRTSALVNTDVIVVMRDVIVDGKAVLAAWLFVGGEEIPARHVEGVYARNQAFLSRVVGAEDQGTKLRLADGTSLLVPGYNKYISNRWRLPYKVLLTDNGLTLYHLLDGRRISVERVK
jgi:hypothetical protein